MKTMEQATAEINLSVKILNIMLEEFYLKDKLPIQVAKSLDKAKIQFEFNVGMNVDVAKKTITIELKTNFFDEEKKKNNIGHMNSKGIFEIANLDDITSKTEGKLPNVVLASLIGIAISSTRGFLILKSEKTFMEGVIMPVINPMSFFQQPVKIEQTTKKF